MASAALGEELSCSICLSLYTEPVSLRCGHNFCRDCIGSALDSQEGSVYSCPECREEFEDRPALVKNRKLCNIVDNFRSLQDQDQKSQIFCTYCVDSPTTASKTCLHCETSMCDKHLTAHNKTVDHVLTEPTSSPSGRKCSIHKKLLEYYCPKHATCLCVSCCLVGKHRGHRVELVEMASEKKKEKLRSVLEQLTTKREAAKQKIQNLQDRKRKVDKKEEEEKQRVIALFEELRRELEAQEQRVLGEISKQVEDFSVSASSLTKRLEVQRDELSKKIRHIENLCNAADAITVLQDQEPCAEDSKVEESSAHDLDDVMVSLLLHRSISGLISSMQSKNKFCLEDAVDLLLDEKTASGFVDLSVDLKTASDSETHLLIRPELPESFTEYSQVMTRDGFSHGRHYWEVEVGDCGEWDVGLCYPSIKREGEESGIGYNKKSWRFCLTENHYASEHDSQSQEIGVQSPVKRLGLYLDHEGGRLTFYQLSEPVRHLQTFTATFTEPLHTVFYVSDGAWVKLASPVFSVKP